MTLHIISKSPQHSALHDAMPYINAEDTVIFIEDGVYCAMANTHSLQAIRQLDCQCCALIEDALARGICLGKDILPISMPDFVAHVFHARKNISWY